MDTLSLFLIAIGLSFDTFAVSVSNGLKDKELSFVNAFKIAFSLALFQSLMPVMGWLFGSTIKTYFEAIDHWIAFSLLLLIGLKMIYDGLFSKSENKNLNPLHLPTLLMLSLATSIDALVVGFGFAFLEINIVAAALIIAFTTGIVAMLGMLFGKKISGAVGNFAEILGGIILIGIGVRILLMHILP
ncbi:MAG TPA: manganese efflux pump MntP family protein [Bacteroidia bacterium]|mgnify:CR=1 FL=1|nr:manganese efflux pump [Sphingobacteriales bacterium]HPD64376.1 manganese efflux pump MntP family protein [Bacteroidia bacterium]HRU66972.1 manganese efflux pump MntP family protein [Bacteroidia bacterium]